MEKETQKNRTGLAIALVILLVGGIASAAWWANTGDSIEDLTPQEATARMTEELLNLESGRMTARVDLEFENAEEIYDNTDFQKIEKAMGVENTDDIVMEMNAAFDTREGARESEVGVQMGLASGDTRSVIAMDSVTLDGKTAYMRMQLPESLIDLATEELDGFDLSFANNTWVEINILELIDTLNLEKLLAQEGITIQNFTEPYNEEEQKAIFAVFQNNLFLPLEERVGEEKINGVKTFKYKVGIDVGKTKTLFTDLFNVYIDIYEKRDYPEKTINEMKTVLEQFEKSFDVNEANEMLEEIKRETNLEIYVWLDRRNGQLHQAQMTLNTRETVDNPGKVTITMNVSEHNEDVKIEVPEESTPVEALIGEFVLRAAGTRLEAMPGALEELTAPEAVEEPEAAKEKKK